MPTTKRRCCADANVTISPADPTEDRPDAFLLLLSPGFEPGTIASKAIMISISPRELVRTSYAEFLSDARMPK